MQSYSSNEVDHATESSHNPAFRQLLVERRDTEQFLKAIAPKYLGVYVVDRRTDLFRDILGPDYFRRIVQDKGDRFSEALRVYASSYVMEEDRGVIDYALNYDRVYEIIGDGRGVDLSYRKSDGTLVNLKIARYSDLPEERDLSLWVYVDEQMDDQKKAAEHQRRISAALAEAQEANGRLKVALQNQGRAPEDQERQIHP